MGVKQTQSNSNIVAKVSRNHGILSKAVDRPIIKLQQPSPQKLVDSPSKKLDSTSTRVTCRNQRFGSRRCPAEHGQHNKIDLQLIQKNKAAGPFLSNKFIDGADQQCKQLLDALGIFHSNKELFVNLLQDPNSLLIKHVEGSTDSRAEKEQQMRALFDGTLTVNKTGDVRDFEETACIHDLKTCDGEPAEESDDSLLSERIVVLKPNPTVLQHPVVRVDHSLQSDREGFFSFKLIKQKMKQAMRVRRTESECLSTHGMSKSNLHVCGVSEDVGKTIATDLTGKGSNSNTQLDDKGTCSSFEDSLKGDQLGKAFYSRNGDKTASTSESNSKNVSQTAVSNHLKRRKSKTREAEKVVSRKMRSKPWGWMMCFSDDGISPAVKTGCHIANHKTNSHFSNKKIVSENKLKLQNEEKESCKTTQMNEVEASSAERKGANNPSQESKISQLVFSDIKAESNLVTEGSAEIINDTAAVNQEGSDSFEALPELGNTFKINGLEENGNTEFSRLDSPSEVQPSTTSGDITPSSSSRLQKGNNPNGSHDEEFQNLPISSQNQLLVNATNFSGFTLETDKSSVDALPFNFEERCSTGLARAQKSLNPAISTCNCCGSISEYVLELLQASVLDWNELFECHSSAWLQNLSFIKKAKVFNGQICGDCVLLLDYFNEVIEDVLHCYTRHFPRLSSFKANFQVDKERALYLEVMKHVDWPLLQQQPPKTLEHIFVRDLVRSRTWIDSSTETEDIVTDIAESILEELTIESAVHLNI